MNSISGIPQWITILLSVFGGLMTIATGFMVWNIKNILTDFKSFAKDLAKVISDNAQQKIDISKIGNEVTEVRISLKDIYDIKSRVALTDQMLQVIKSQFDEHRKNTSDNNRVLNELAITVTRLSTIAELNGHPIEKPEDNTNTKS